jgi:hypothetical protein
VNRVWKQFFGRGIVEPVNQFDLARLDPDNPPEEPWTLQPSNPRLLNALAQDLIEHGYDLRYLMRLITNSEAYQLSAHYDPAKWQPSWEPLFARKLVRRLWGEELVDSISLASGVPNTFNVGTRNPDGTTTNVVINWAMKFPEPSAEPQGFLQSFIPGNRDDQERRTEGSLLQALSLMNDGNFVLNKITNASAGTLLQRALGQTDDDAVFTLYTTILSRPPSDDEKTKALETLRTGLGNRTQRLQNLMWSLYNRVEFIFNY